MINSPLNYTGNKFKLLKQIIPFINSDNDNDSFVDVFAGSGLVALNSNYKNIWLNDGSPRTIELLDYFINTESIKIVEDIDKIIAKYGFTDTDKFSNKNYLVEKHEGLSKYNKEPFSKLKKDYNTSPSVDKLFALVIFGFNHYIRFNSKGEFNVPVGKVDYSTSLRKKTLEYSAALKNKNIRTSNFDFRSSELYKYRKSFFYFDPPYLITTAPYNSSWIEKDEKDLLNILDSLNNNGTRFALSNVMSSNGKINHILKTWSLHYNVIYLDRKYLNSNYRKKNLTIAQEVLVTNF